MTLTLTTLADHPELYPAIEPLLLSRWPVFMLAGTPGHGLDVTEVLGATPDLQVLLTEDDDVLAVGLCVAITWDGTTVDLPTGWDGAVSRAGALLVGQGTPDAVCALSITMAAAATGRGMSTRIVAALKAAATAAGAKTLLVPVRPMLKDRYPLIAMDDYLTWRDDRDRPFDPWLRLHLDAGASLIGVAQESMTITGSVAQWEAWTGLSMPTTGSYVVPGALAPVAVDVEADTGTYVEPNVWVSYLLGE